MHPHSHQCTEQRASAKQRDLVYETAVTLAGNDSYRRLRNFGEAKLRSLMALTHLLVLRRLKFPTSPKLRMSP
jgi:hypothetical protein